MKHKEKKKMEAVYDGVFEKILHDSSKEKKKSRTQNDICDIINEDTLQITNQDNNIFHKSIIEWSEIKDKRYGFDEHIDLWTKQKFFSYLRYRVKCVNLSYKDHIDCSIGLARRHTYIKELIAKIAKIYKQPANNDMLRKYIDFYVQNLLEKCVAAKGEFDLYDLYKSENIRSFLKVISTQKDIEENVSIQHVSDKLTIAKIQEAYESGGVTFLSTAGIIYSYGFLKNHKNIDTYKCIKVLQSFVNDARREGPIVIDKIKEITMSYNSYSHEYADKELLDFLLKLQIKVEFNQNGTRII
jgi:hypothetical protein